MHQYQDSFATLFKKYRLRSEIETLSQFGDLLAEKGLVYENSLFTHWQKGDRVPKDRKLILAVIEIFVEKGGIKTIEEANSILSSIYQPWLTHHELYRLHLVEQSKNKNSTSSIHVQISSTALVKETLRSNYFYASFFLFFIQSILYLRLQLFQLTDSFDAIIWSFIYSMIALHASVYGLHLLSKASLSNRYAHLAKFLCVGLFCQWLGLTVWNTYNLLGVLIPYPSFADLGYLASCVVYLVASILLIFNLSEITSFYRSIRLLIAPFIVLIICYSFFLEAIGYTFYRQVVILLTIVYPFIGIVSVTIGMYSYVKHVAAKNYLAARISLCLSVACLLQFFSDFFFIYSVQTETYVNGGLNDYLYSIAYILMALLIMLLTRNSILYSSSLESDVSKSLSTTHNKYVFITLFQQYLRRILLLGGNKFN